jgi:hypothetical protein
MKIRMRAHYAGDGFFHEPGDVIDRPTEVAMRLVSHGHAVALEPMRETTEATRVAETRTPTVPKKAAGRKRR